MNGAGVIDQFLNVFTRYIDSGFGLLQGETRWLAGALIAIDMTLAALFWAWAPDEDVVARLVKKVLFVGVFAYLINNWNTLSRIVFESFAGLGLKASGAGLSEADFLRPGRVAQVGLDAGKPILDAISGLMGYVSFFENFIQIMVLLLAWLVVVLAFFVLAIQLFVTLIEFKLTSLAGFVLIPFGLFNKTAFAAERVLGNVMSSGIKVLVLAVILGIGSTLFAQFTSGVPNAPTLQDALSLMLAALTLLGLGVFGPGIANGLVSGGPQLGAGAALGTGAVAGGAALGAAALAAGGAGLVGGALAATARGGATLAGAASAAYGAGAAGQSGAAAVVGGLDNVARAGADAAASPLRRAAQSLKQSFARGSSLAAREAERTDPDPAPAGEPGWAAALRQTPLGPSPAEPAIQAAHAARTHESGGPGAAVDLSEDPS